MNTPLRSLLLVTVAVVGISLWSTPAKADHDHRFDRLDSLATRLEAETRTLAAELRRYRFADPNLRAAAREVSSIARDASHIHDLIHSGGSIHPLHRDVVSIQEEVHHLDEHLAPYHHFSRHVQRIDALVHALDNEIHNLERPHAARRPVYGYPSYTGGSGLTFGNGGFSIRIGR